MTDSSKNDTKKAGAPELWRMLPDCDDRYEVSNLGRIRMLYFRNGTTSGRLKEPVTLKPQLSHDRYLRISLRVGSPRKRRSFGVHTLVLKAFIGPRPPGYHAAHLDGDSLNNRLENLKWCTEKENHRHKQFHASENAVLRDRIKDLESALEKIAAIEAPEDDWDSLGVIAVDIARAALNKEKQDVPKHVWDQCS